MPTIAPSEIWKAAVRSNKWFPNLKISLESNGWMPASSLNGGEKWRIVLGLTRAFCERVFNLQVFSLQAGLEFRSKNLKHLN